MVTETRATPARQSLFLDRLAPKVNDPFALFSLLFAFGVLNHTHTLGSITANYSNVGVTLFSIAAVALLIWPSSRRLLVAMSAGVAISVLSKMPSVVNHWLAFGVITLAYLAVATITLRESDREGRRAILTAGTMYIGAVAIVCVWAVAAFHKLNSGFFDTVYSCALDHTNDLTRLFGLGRPVGGGFIGWLIIIAAIGTEILVPLFLLLRRRRLFGLALAFGFHLVMAVNGHQAFSGLALALYVPFLPNEIWRGFDPTDIWERITYRYIQLAGMFMAALGAALTLMGSNYNLHWRGRMFYIVGSTLVAAIVFRALRRSQAFDSVESTMSSLLGKLDDGARRAISVIAIVVVAAFAINGLAPYLGIKSQLTISMYSNLRVESDERWNHLLVPEAVRVFGGDDDMIRVVNIADENIDWLEGKILHRFEVRRRLSAACDGTPIALAYSVDGSSIQTTIADACESEFGQKPSLLQRKLLTFREVVEPNECQW